MLNGIFRKLISMFIVILFVSFSTSGILLYYTLGSFIQEREKESLNKNILRAVGILEKNLGNQKFLDNIDDYLDDYLNIISINVESMVILVDNKGNIIKYDFSGLSEKDVKLKDIRNRIIYEYDGKLSNPKQYENIINGSDVKIQQVGDFYGLFEDDVQWLTIGIPFKAEGFVDKKIVGAIYLCKPLPYISNDRVDIIKLFIFAVFIATIIAIILAYIFSIRLTSPLKEITKAVKVMSKGDFKELLNIEASDEVGELVDSFNQMVKELRNLENMRRGFVANVSHELRTPVTSIRGFVEGIIDGTIPKEKHNEYLDIVRDEAVRLNRLVNNLLDLAKMETGETTLHYTKFDINELVRRIIIRFEQMIVEKDLNIKANFDSEYIYVSADKDSIERVIINLFHNAIKFTNEKGEISIETKVVKNKVYVSISDTGIGINEEELSKIWERFYKTDKSRGEVKKGSGLGLAIVKNIINEHGEEIVVDSTLKIGTKFVFTLQKVNNNEHDTEKKNN